MTALGLALVIVTPALALAQAAPAATHPTPSSPGAPATMAPAAGVGAPAQADAHAGQPATTSAPTAAALHGETAPTADAGQATPTAPVEAGHAQPAADPSHAAAAQPAGEHGAAPGAHAPAEEHAESPWGLIARLFNFIVLVGALWYFLRAPATSYLSSRSQQIRTELVTAKETTATATRQLAEIDQKLKALPAELAELKKRGAEEIVAEEARIKQTAEAERHRLLEQTRREIDLQVRLAKRDLTDYAATLAVDLASERIKQTATPDDQQRLIDRYVTQVRTAHE